MPKPITHLPLLTGLFACLLSAAVPASAQVNTTRRGGNASWNDAPSWTNGVPDSNTHARFTKDGNYSLPYFPTEGPATARSLTISNEDSSFASLVSLRNGNLNLTPGSVYETALKVGTPTTNPADYRSAGLTLQNAILASSGIAEIGTGGAYNGSQLLNADMALSGSGATWVHTAGLIDVGGPNSSATLRIDGGTLAGSLIPGFAPNPNVILNQDSLFAIRYGGQALLSELTINSEKGLVLWEGSLGTNRLIVGESASGRASLKHGSTASLGEVSVKTGELNVANNSTADTISVTNGTLEVRFDLQPIQDEAGGKFAVVGAGHLEVGNAQTSGSGMPSLRLAPDSGMTAQLVVTGNPGGGTMEGGYDGTWTPPATPQVPAANSKLTVHGSAEFAGYGTATTKVTSGGAIVIQGDAFLGRSESQTGGAAGNGAVEITGSGSVMGAQNAEVGYSYFDSYGSFDYASPTGRIAVGDGGRLEISGRTETYTSYSPYGSYTQTSHYAGNLTLGKNGTLDVLDPTGRVVFADPSHGEALIGRSRLTNYGLIKGGGADLGPGGSAQIDFGSRGGTLINLGTLDPGHSPGWLTINGDVSFTDTWGWSSNAGRLRIELGGSRAGLDYDVLEILGQADFTGGTLEISLINGYVPQAGDYFDFLRVGGNVNGWFSHFINHTGLDFDFLGNAAPSNGWFRLSVPGGGGSTVPEGGNTSLLLVASFLSLLVVRARRASTTAQCSGS